MKTLIIASLLAASSTFAFASSGNSETWEIAADSKGSTLTRAQVINELHEARVNNTIAYGEHASKHNAKPSVSVLSRRQVVEEVLALRKAGKLPVDGERSPGDYNHSQL